MNAMNPTNELVLHQYDSSPFSEKVRLVLGWKRLAWRAVAIPVVMPKPDLVALTGGYRRTPVLQIGADIYCDSALIVRTVDRLQPEPPLYPDEQPLAESVAAWIDSTLFWTMIVVAMQPAGLPQVFAGLDPEQAKAFAADRAAFTAGLPRPSLADALPQFATYLGRFERQLRDGREFLFGARPGIADFSLAHNVWFIRRLPALDALLAPYPRVLAWFERMRGFGHGTVAPLGSGDAVELAARSEPSQPRFEPAPGFTHGQRVTVAAIDYGSDPVAGSLVGLSADEVAIARDDELAGRVVVHFPRIGFRIRKEGVER